MPYDDWKARDPRLEELPMDDDDFVEGQDDFEVEVEARGARAHSIERDARDHGLKATVGPDNVYIVGPYDKLFTLLSTTVGMSPEEAHRLMRPVVQAEADMNEDEINPVFDDEIEMRDEKHADPSGREWSSGLDETDQDEDDLDQASMIQASMIESESGPKCLLCDKAMSTRDKDAYEAEGGEGWPETCEDCAEMPTHQHEGVSFDKFMDSVVIKENAQRKVEAADTPQRIYNKRYREKALNRMRVRRLP